MKVGIVPISTYEETQRLSKVLALESRASEWLSRDSTPGLLSLALFFSIWGSNIKFYLKFFKYKKHDVLRKK